MKLYLLGVRFCRTGTGALVNKINFYYYYVILITNYADMISVSMTR